MARKGTRRWSAALVLLLLCCSAFGRDGGPNADSMEASEHPSLAVRSAGPAMPDQSPPVAPFSRPIRTDVDVVLVAVSVVDPMDRMVTGLTKDNFQIFEDKKPQQLSDFSTEDTPISVGVIFDTSGSMADKIDKSKIAVAQFLKTANPADEFFLISFGDRPEKISGFTKNVQPLETKLISVDGKGQTSLLDAIYLGLDEMKKAKYSRKALVVISDGGDNHSRYTENDVRKAVKESDVQIYSIGIFEDIQNRARTPEEMAGPGLLSDLGEMTGGRLFTVDNIDNLPATAAKLGREMRSVYVLAYHPDNSHRDGKWRKISVKLRVPKQILSQLRLFSRSGYYAPVE